MSRKREAAQREAEAARARAAAPEEARARTTAAEETRARAVVAEATRVRAAADAEDARVRAAAAAEVIPWLRGLGLRAEEARRAAEPCQAIPDAPLEERVRYALRGWHR